VEFVTIIPPGLYVPISLKDGENGNQPAHQAGVFVACGRFFYGFRTGMVCIHAGRILVVDDDDAIRWK
jgi:hypothetical protein